jgi:hypothetical protein
MRFIGKSAGNGGIDFFLKLPVATLFAQQQHAHRDTLLG